MGILAHFPTTYKDLRPVELVVRMWTIDAWQGGFATESAAAIEEIIPQQGHVRIPFITRKGVRVTLLGGDIHACPQVTWDILGPDGWEFEGEYECISTVEMLRRIRTL